MEVSSLDAGTGHAPDRVGDELADLARHGASGALILSGEPGGTLHLRDGRLVFAETAAAPDLGSRLVNSRRLLPDQWHRAEQDSGPDGCAGGLLLARGLIDAAEWDIVVRSALLDALIAVAMQLATDPAAGTCFTAGQGRRGRPGLTLDPAQAWKFARQEAGLLVGQGVAPDARLRLREPGQGMAVSRHRAVAVLGHISGHATLAELAWRHGLTLYGVMDWAARLIADGVCVVGGPAARTTAPASQPGSPARQPGTAVILPDRHLAGIRWALPDRGLLQQVLDGLRQLG